MSRVTGQRARRIESFAGVITSVVLNALAVLVATRLLGAEGRGQMVGLGLVSTLVHVLLGLGLPGANVYFAARRPRDTRVLIGNSLGWSICLPVLAWMIALLVPDALIPGPRLGLSAEQIRYAILFASPIMAFQQIASVVQGLGRFRLLFCGRAIQGVCLLLGVAAYPLFAEPSPFGMYIVWVASYALGAITFTVSALERNVPTFAGETLRSSLGYGVKAMWTQVWEFVNMRGDQILVAGLADASALGIYSIAVSLSEILFHAPNAVSAVVFSDTASGEIPNQHAEVARESRLLLTYTVLAGIILVAGTHVVVVPLVGLQDARLSMILGIMVVPVSVLAAARLLAAYVMGRGHPGVPSIAAATSFGVTLVADLLLVPRYGALGAAVGVSLGYAVAATVMLCVFVRMPAVTSTAEEAVAAVAAPDEDVLL